MGGHALILATIAVLVGTSVAAAQDRVEVQLPDCRPPHVDTPLLAEVLAIELDDTAGESIVVALSSSLCDPTRDSVEVWIRDAASEREARAQIALSAEADPVSRARALALAIAERARLALGTRTLDADVAATTTAPGALPSATPEPAITLREPSRARETLADPIASDPSPAPTTAPDLGPALELALLGRIAPVLPSWALGLRGGVRAHLDATWSLRGGILASWSRASPREGDVDALVVALAGDVALTLLRDALVEVLLEGTVEAGVLVAMGSPADGAGRTTEHPWSALGLALEGAVRVSRELVITGALGASGVLTGTRVWTASGTQIDLSLLVLDATVGARMSLP